MYLKGVYNKNLMKKILSKAVIHKETIILEEIKDVTKYYKQAALDFTKYINTLVGSNVNSIFIYGSVAKNERLFQDRVLEKRFMIDSRLLELELEYPGDRKIAREDIDIGLITEKELGRFYGLESILSMHALKYPDIFFTIRVFNKQNILNDIIDLKQPKFFRRLFLFSPFIIIKEDGTIDFMRKLAHQMLLRRDISKSLDIQYELDRTLFKHLQRTIKKEGIFSVKITSNLLAEFFTTKLLEINGKIDGRPPKDNTLLFRIPKRDRRVQVIKIQKE